MLIATVLDYDSGQTRTAHGERYDILAFFHQWYPETRQCDRMYDCVDILNKDGYYKAEVEPAEEPSNMRLEEQSIEDPWAREADSDGNL